jgi:phage regulator Rha-like protein
MLSLHLAELYNVEHRVLSQFVKRNPNRFPQDFMFQLTWEEFEILRSQIVSANFAWSKIRYAPYAFTEQGVAMLSSVLRSDRAVQVNIRIMRAFVKLRQILASNVELSKRLDEMERKYDKQFAIVFQAIKELMTPEPKKPKAQIGF